MNISYLPFAWIGMVVFIAASAVTVLNPHMTRMFALACGGLAFCALILWVLLRRYRNSERRRDWRIFLFHGASLLLAAGGLFALYANKYFTTVEPVQQLAKTTATVRMEPLDYPTQRYGKFYYPMKILELDGEPVTPFQVRFTCSEALECEPCDWIVCQVEFYSFTAGEMYSTFSSQLAEGNLLGAYPIGYNDYQVEPNPDSLPLGRLLPLLRRHMSRGLDRCLSPDEAALLKTVLLGRGSELSNQVYTDFRQIGCSHMLAVSGLHMTLVGAFLNLLLSRLAVRRGLRSLLSVLLLFCYLLLTGFPVSAVRSYVMFVLCTLASSTHQPGDTLNSLGVAVVVLCFSDPFAGGNVGFALSVLATAGIALLGRQLQDIICPPRPKASGIYPILRRMAGTLSTSLSATLFTLPVQVAVFHGIPLLTLASNLLLLPLFVSMLDSALPLLLLSQLAPTGLVIQPFVLICGLQARLLLRLSHWMASLPGVYLSLTDPLLLAALVLFLLGISLCFSRRSKPRTVLASLLLGLAVFMPILHSEVQWDTVTLAVSGDSESACVVAMRNGRASVLSMGTFNSGLARQILVQGNISRLETVLVAGQSYRTKAMTQDLLANYQPEQLWLYGQTYGGKDLSYPGVTLETVPENGLYQALPGVVVQIVDDGAKLRIWTNGKKLVLAQGDCTSETCDLLITNASQPQIDTARTLFLCDEGMSPEDAALGLYSDFSIATDQSVTYVDISPSGEIHMYTQ